MSTGIADYKGRFVKTKEVVVEDGAVFEIRRISPLDMWEKASTSTQKAEPAKIMEVLITKGVISPKITLDGQGDTLPINDVPFEHLNKLVEEILKFSGIPDKNSEGTDFLSQEKKA